MKPLDISVSASCLNLARLRDELASLEEARCHALHIDIADGKFVSQFAGGIDILNAVRQCSSLPCIAHLMVREPDRHINQFIQAGCAGIIIHLEACLYAHRTLSLIREAGASPGLAITPATPLTKLEYVLNLADTILVQAREYGQTGDPVAFERVRILKENIQYRELSARVEVEGVRTITDIAVLANEGADAIVIDSKELLGDASPGEAINSIRQAVEAEQKVV